MQYSEIKLQTMELLAEIAEGSSTFEDENYEDGIQWGQEQIGTLLGLTYFEFPTAATGVTGPTGDIVQTVVIPDDAIKVLRVMITDAPEIPEEPEEPEPEASYSIEVSPAVNNVSYFMQEIGSSDIIIIFTVTITRTNGHNKAIDLTWNADFTGVYAFDVYVNNSESSGVTPITVDTTPDSFQILIIGNYDALSSSGIFEDQIITGLDSSGLAKSSNTFKVVATESYPPFTISVSPSWSALEWDFSGDPSEDEEYPQSNTPVLTATITRDAGHTSPIRIMWLTDMNTAHGLSPSGLSGIMNGEDISHMSPVLVNNVPDEFTFSVEGTFNAWQLMWNGSGSPEYPYPWPGDNNFLIAIDDNGISSFSNYFLFGLPT